MKNIPNYILDVLDEKTINSLYPYGCTINVDHPYNYINPNSLHSYDSRKLFMEYYNSMFKDYKFTFPTKKIHEIHPLFMIAELEYYIRFMDEINFKNMIKIYFPEVVQEEEFTKLFN